MADVYAFDSNIYIRALRDRQQLAALKRFLLRAGNRVRVNAMVALELRAGARTDVQAGGLDALLRPYVERERVVVPSFDAYVQAGRVLSVLGAREPGLFAYPARSFVNDAIIAASCREDDVVLVTENASDFAAIKRHLRGFRFADSTILSAAP